MFCRFVDWIGPADVKVKTVVDAREPMIAAEVRSFLGLVHITARFIPDLATVSVPLRQLMKKPFACGLKQQQSFDELKRRLSSAETPGLGAALVQQQGEDLWVITYASRYYLR